jgi:hypothetical protein
MTAPNAATWPNVMDALAGIQPAPGLTGTLPIVLLTWAGTGSDLFNTAPPQPAGVAQAAAAAFPNVFTWQPVDYPASIFDPNMGASVTAGFNEGVRLASQVYPNNLVIPIGYSQGAICASHFWRDYILANNLQARIPAALVWGNPCRSPGFANGNAYAGWGMPGTEDGVVTGGISGPDNLLSSQTPSNWFDFVWLGTDGGATELYTNAPVGTNPWTAESSAGLDETLLYNIIVSQNFEGTLEGLLALVESAAAQFVNPISEVVGIAEAIFNGLNFLGAGAAADHYAYNVQPMIDYLTQVVAPQYA